ncbi:unnamed protein product [Echinostoma caproni]|uniref:Chitobiosyldiphosphodolichol beta-mannosyltransferase n=1 Tax=Echinostoma caproni TaxID=27848 RepID=A0A183AR31_9TREM|nr:unnamed protein product [Echinostoma caproni]
MPAQTVHVIVLGDVTRSPRILSQACFLANEGCFVTVSGYNASLSVAAKTKNMKALDLIDIPNLRKYMLVSTLALLVKVILVQNPPAVPTLLVLWMFIRLTGRKLVIDWHNYGFTLLELTTKPGTLLPRIYRMLELTFASFFLSSDVVHLCVSRALKKDLSQWNIEAHVYYDRAPDDFTATPVDAAHEVFMRLKSEYPSLGDQSGSSRKTRFTEITTLPTDCGGQVAQWRIDRPALVLSSCSYTPDDDFRIMIEALETYNQLATQPDSKLPHMVFVVTGRGPLKAHYEQLIREKNWDHVEVIMPWLTTEDYPIFLGCADLGISLHRSSSGLDLPMKVVDLMGVGVPVLALSYETLHELLPDHTFGEHFHTADELANQLRELLKPSQPKSSRRPRSVDRFDAVGSAKLRAYRDVLVKHNRTTLRGLKYWRKVGAPPVYRALNACS